MASLKFAAVLSAALVAGPVHAADLKYSGRIDDRSAALVLQGLDAHRFERIVVDSAGGERIPAIALAYRIRAGGWPLVVKGRCFSACANYLFTAARRKSVLPGSFVIIHSTTVGVRQGFGRRTLVSGNEILDAVAGAHDSDPKYEDKMRQYQAGREFQRTIGVSDALVRAFDDYHSRRKRMLGMDRVDHFKGTPECPRLLGWALNRAQLESAGVTGIEDFWFPANAQEQALVYQQVALPRGAIFFGEAARLQDYCNGPPLPWVRRAWLYLTARDRVGRRAQAPPA